MRLDKYEIDDINYSPFRVSWSQKETLKCVSKYKEKKKIGLTAYTDASGNFTTKSEKNSKISLHYSVIINIKLPGALNGNNIEISGMISESHCQITIAKFFFGIRIKCLTIGIPWPLFNDVITDHSYSNINGICVGFNNVTLLQYLQKVHLHWTQKIELDKNLVKLHSCIAHVQKNWTREISTFGQKNNFSSVQISEIKKIFSNVFLIRSYREFQDYLRYMIIFFCSKHENEYFKESANVLISVSEGEEILKWRNELDEASEKIPQKIQMDEEDQRENLQFEGDLENCADGREANACFNDEIEVYEPQDTQINRKSLFRLSPFFHDAVQLYKLVRNLVNSNCTNRETMTKNQYHAPELIKMYMKRFVSELPLLINGPESPNLPKKFVFVNNFIEGYFRQLRKYLDDRRLEYGVSPINPGRFLDLVHEYSVSKLSRIQTNYVGRKNVIVLAERNDDGLYTINSQEEREEEWNVKNKKKVLPKNKTHLSSRTLPALKASVGKCHGTEVTEETLEDISQRIGTSVIQPSDIGKEGYM